MDKIVYGQYDSLNYPLKRYFYKDLPQNIDNTIMELNHKRLAIFRGGLAFVFLLNESEYLLKDLDMLATEFNKTEILDVLTNAEKIFVNKNIFGNSVITAFWLAEEDYYKLDILVCKELPSVSKCNFDNKERLTVAVSYIWRNRIEKIADKDMRKHDDKKTLNHYHVACKLSKYLINHKDEINVTDTKIVETILYDVGKVLRTLLVSDESEKFIELQLELIRR